MKNMQFDQEGSVYGLKIPLFQQDYWACLVFAADLQDEVLQDFQSTLKKDKSLSGLKGEELVACLLERYKGNFSSLAYQKDGKWGNMHNGPNGEPASQDFDKRGQMTRKMYSTDSGMTDGPNGEPCWQKLDETGYVCEAARYKNGRKTSVLTVKELHALNAPLPPKKGIGTPSEPKKVKLREETMADVRDMLKKKNLDWL